jgi:hypothetical protein
MIDAFIRALVAAGTHPDFRNIEDILWLAQNLTSDELPIILVEAPVGESPIIPIKPLLDELPIILVEAPVDESPIIPVEAPLDESPIIPEKKPLDDSPSIRDVGNDMTIGLYAMSKVRGPDQNIRASAVRVPSVPALPGTLEIGRSLRPLKRRRAAASRFNVDSEATAEQSAETGVLMPVIRPMMERWFDVALVLDDGPSMAVWRDTNLELYWLLARHGAFRDVRRWTLAANREKAVLVSESGLTQHWRGLMDRTSRRLILLVTDCTGSHWDHAAVWEMLTCWGESTPTALIQVLPERLWVSTALGSTPATASSRIPGVPNTKLNIEQPSWDVSDKALGVPVPVITLEPATTAAWSNVIMGGSSAVATTIARVREALRSESAYTVKIDPKERVRRFKALVSPTAYQLSVYLSGVPLTLPVMRLVQYVMLPDSHQSHLAEFFLGGLIERTTQADASITADEVEYEFHEQVRDLLQGSMRRSEALRILQAVSRHLEENYGTPLDFKALIPAAQGHYRLPVRAIPFATVGARLLERIGHAAARYTTSLDFSDEKRDEPPETQRPLESDAVEKVEPLSATQESHMDDMDDLTVMISHASVDTTIATAWRRLLGRVLPAAKLLHSMKPPAWAASNAEQVLDWIRQSRCILTIQTPNTASQSWSIWEAGMARALQKGIFVAVYGIAPGRLMNPLDSQRQFEGANKSDVGMLLRDIASVTKDPYRERDFEEAFVEYANVLQENAHLFQSEDIQYEKRIRLELTYDQREKLQQTGVIPDLASVRAAVGSLDIFGYSPGVEEITWADLIIRLTENHAERPLPGSALAWTKQLGRLLRDALNRQLTSRNPEDLPLFWERNANGGGISYRPSITNQIRAAGLTSFTVSFTRLPRELTARPGGAFGLISNYLDFTEMMRWGILKDRRFESFFRGDLPQEQMISKQAEFVDALLNIQIQFLNRGLSRYGLIEAFPPERRGEVETVLEGNDAILSQLEPEKRPTVEQIRNFYPKLLSINTTSYKWLLERSLELLSHEAEKEGS